MVKMYRKQKQKQKLMHQSISAETGLVTKGSAIKKLASGQSPDTMKDRQKDRQKDRHSDSSIINRMDFRSASWTSSQCSIYCARPDSFCCCFLFSPCFTVFAVIPPPPPPPPPPTFVSSSAEHNLTDNLSR